jgi:AcrR family transcriptional regulator
VATQLDRRDETRARLLDAAVDVLVEQGIVDFTTVEVGRRAGVSPGTLAGYFATKADLLCATVQQLYAGFRLRYDEQLARLRPDLAAPDRLRIGFVMLWELFQDPRLRATYDLFTAARTDEALRAHLAPVVRANSEHLYAVAHQLFGDAVTADASRFQAAIDIVTWAMHGMISSPAGSSDAAADQRALALLAELAIEAVTGTPG